ncbi:MAG: GNAT family protein [Ginsengibacter sp.]
MRDFTKDEIILENEHVLLRPLVASDSDNLLAFALNEPSIWTYSLVSPGGSKEALDHYIDITLKLKEQGKEYAFIVFDKKQNKYAGSTRFYDINLEYNTVQLGYTWYGTSFQRTGLNRNCKLLLLEFAFEHLNVDRVEFRADANNKRSVSAMKNIGCTVEGILRSNMPTQDPEVRRDSIVLSILKHEWFNTVKRRLIAKIH